MKGGIPVDSENIQGQDPVEGTVHVGSRIMTEEAKQKQAESMKARWQDPAYKANVSKGRFEKKIVKLEAEIAASTDAEVTAKLRAQVDETIAKLNALGDI